MTRSKAAILAVVLLAMLGLAVAVNWSRLKTELFKPTESSVKQGLNTAPSDSVEIIANELTVPWEIAFLPEGDMLVTERSGQLTKITGNQQSFAIEGVQHIGEGGLLGLAVHPNFVENRWVYLYLTTASGDGLINRVERYKFSDNQLSDKKEIISDIPGARYHDGGRMAFGPDGNLYITTGDAGNEDLAQDTGSLAGKILRLTPEGEIPADNPFANAVYSYGHRNPQGLAWDEMGRLWSTEHGPSGLQSGLDELNLIKPGANYGWPVIGGDEEGRGMENPIVHSGTDDVWAPAGLAYADGSLFFAGLRGETLYEAELGEGEEVKLQGHFRQEYGRLRAVASQGDALYISTSNTDGRGTPMADDDRILRIGLGLFQRDNQ